MLRMHAVPSGVDDQTRHHHHARKPTQHPRDTPRPALDLQFPSLLVLDETNAADAHPVRIVGRWDGGARDGDAPFDVRFTYRAVFCRLASATMKSPIGQKPVSKCAACATRCASPTSARRATAATRGAFDSTAPSDVKRLRVVVMKKMRCTLHCHLYVGHSAVGRKPVTRVREIQCLARRRAAGRAALTRRT